MFLGYHKILQNDDLPQLPRSLASKRLAVGFLQAVQERLFDAFPSLAHIGQAGNSSGGAGIINSGGNGSSNSSGGGGGGSDYYKHNEATRIHIPSSVPPQFSLFRVLNASFGLSYYPLGVLRFLADFIGFSGPLLLNALVSFIEDDSEPMWHGYMYGVLLVAGTLTSAIFNAQYNYLVTKAELKIRAALVTSIYAKSLRIGSFSSHTFSSGQIINFMSTDTDRVVNFCPSFHSFWSLPVQVIITLYLLYVQIGYAFLAGLVISLLLIPINKGLSNKISMLSKSMMAAKDSRVKLMNEILNGIRVVKFYAWENALTQKIETFRALEMKALRGRKYLDALCVYFWATTPVLISILSFVAFVLISGSDQLTAAKVFTSLSLFNMLIAPLNAFPWVLNGLIEAWVSMKRIEAYLVSADFSRIDDLRTSSLDFIKSPHQEESLHHQYYHNYSVRSSRSSTLSTTEHFIIYMRDAEFQWTSTIKDNGNSSNSNGSSNSSGISGGSDNNSNSDGKNNSSLPSSTSTSSQVFRLYNINLAISKGQLVGIFGSVGCGKSSLFSAILGEMSLVSGVFQLNLPKRPENTMQARTANSSAPPSIAYASQQPWIQNATVQSNILFGLPLQKEIYSKVLFACALLPDLKILIKGDQTDIGENGVTLSGGQKARISLARAVYRSVYFGPEKSELVLLDDPLSAVDSHVASHIMKYCITGLLKAHTVLLVTHHVHHLISSCDVLVYIQQNTLISGQRGSYEWDALAYSEFAAQSNAIGNKVSTSETAAPTLETVERKKGKSAILSEDGPVDEHSSIVGTETDKAFSLDDTNIDVRPLINSSNARKAREGEIEEEHKEEEVGIEGHLDDTSLNPSARLMTTEQRESGVVKIHVHMNYWKSMGKVIAGLVFLSLALMQASRNVSDWWLSYWVEEISGDDNSTVTSTGTNTASMLLLSNIVVPLSLSQNTPFHFFASSNSTSNSTTNGHSDSYYLIIFGALAGTNSFLTFLRAFIFAYGGLRASQVIHNKLLFRVLNAPISFFDTTPVSFKIVLYLLYNFIFYFHLLSFSFIYFYIDRLEEL